MVTIVMLQPQTMISAYGMNFKNSDLPLPLSGEPNAFLAHYSYRLRHGSSSLTFILFTKNGSNTHKMIIKWVCMSTMILTNWQEKPRIQTDANNNNENIK